jgi:phage-related protein
LKLSKSAIAERDNCFACFVYPIEYNGKVKVVRFLGDSRKVLQSFPNDARQNAGRQLLQVQVGKQANDCKPMPSIGKGVDEIRIWGESGTYRVIYTARMAEAVYVLHAFQKKTRATSPRDVKIARERFQQLMRGRK